MNAKLIALVTAFVLGGIALTVWLTAESRDALAVAPATPAPAPSPLSGEATDLRLPSAESERPARVEPLPSEEATPDSTAKHPERLRDTLQWLARMNRDAFGELTLEQAEALTELDLRGLDVYDTDLARLEALPNLESLGLRATEVTDAGLASLQRLGRLTSLDLRATLVSGVGLPDLPRGLEQLHLTSTQVQGVDLFRLPPMPNLQQLKLNFLELDDTALDILAGYPNLRHVELDRTAISDDGLRRMLQYNPEITRVEIRDTKHVSASTVQELEQLYPGCEFVKATPWR